MKKWHCLTENILTYNKNVTVDHRTRKNQNFHFLATNIFFKSLFAFNNKNISNIISMIIHFINVYRYRINFTYDIELYMNQFDYSNPE